MLHRYGLARYYSRDMEIKKIIVPVLCAIIFFGLGFWFLTDNKEGGVTTEVSQVPAGSTGSESVVQSIDQNKKIMNATLHTTMGDITIELTPDATPNTVANFVKLAQEGFYDGTKFHRVIQGFMNQGGDPLSQDDSQMARWGTGGPGYSFPDEIGPNNSNALGTISMANAGPNTNGSQFFINAADNFGLDPKHTVFGRVTSGLDVVMAINVVPTGPADRPLEAVVIKGITLK